MTAYEIWLHGCDDSTKVERMLEPAEVDLLEAVAAQSKESSEYGCMPIMEIKESGK